MPHFFVSSQNKIDNHIIIDDTQNYKHIAKSLRAKCGESLLLIDENRIQYETIISKITQKEITAEILSSYESKRKLKFNLYLAQSPLRSDAQNVIMEKATELGAAGVYPVLTDNCALNKSVIEKKIPRWQKIMYEASKQCERADIPNCYEPTNIESLIENGGFDYVIAFCERFAEKTFKTFYAETGSEFFKNSKILVIIGPEGGFSNKELGLFKGKSIPMLTLGDLILKAETAVITALGNIIYEYNSCRTN